MSDIHSVHEVVNTVGHDEYVRLIEEIFQSMERRKKATALDRIRAAITRAGSMIRKPAEIGAEIKSMVADGVISSEEAAALAVKNLLLPAEVGVTGRTHYS